MSKDFDALRRQFYEDDPDDPFTVSGTSSSTAAASAGPSRSRQAQSTRPNARSTAQTNRSSGISVPADDPLGGLGLGRGLAPALAALSDAMDVDNDRDRYQRLSVTLNAREGAAHEIEREELDAMTGTGAGSDVQRLLRAWQAERHAPVILPVEGELLGRVLDAIRQQSSDVATLRMAGDLTEEDHYRTMLVQTEVERVRFIVRSYVRTRLFKIEQYAAYITREKDIQERLTEAELRHAQRYAELVVSQLDRTILRHLPEAQRTLDDEVPTMPSMISEPDLDKPVFVRFRAAEGRIELADESVLELTRGATLLVPFRAVEQHVLRGEAELV